MNPWQQDVLEFHQKFGAAIGEAPLSEVARPLLALRSALIEEETNELLDALDSLCARQPLSSELSDGKKVLPEEPVDLEALWVRVADGLVDSIYVIAGTAVALGIDLAPLWREVHRSNMAKQPGIEREDGKILKPEGWQPPQLLDLLRDQTRPGYGSFRLLFVSDAVLNDLLERAGVERSLRTILDQDEKLICLHAISNVMENLDDNWWRDFYQHCTLTHMVRTEEGWIPAACNTREHTGEDPQEVLEEVNRPDA